MHIEIVQKYKAINIRETLNLLVLSFNSLGNLLFNLTPTDQNKHTNKPNGVDHNYWAELEII